MLLIQDAVHDDYDFLHVALNKVDIFMAAYSMLQSRTFVSDAGTFDKQVYHIREVPIKKPPIGLLMFTVLDKISA
ncbi:predicted protein [Plenodomus lingam JN3]|uniref:Uncharacterized protein n=1 Tax=Leptosphaeria maculans (strain JN3 / isolate v23.1.3 / race Av1-4-5-6-7-8) TaxID=985895 RepID=E4ZFQ9_LEPMJ|nr:predicted protein [Plenodomus lingam JN3]CBX90129.1 predicted protein [Plenodomus lingam JN3]